MSELRLTLKSLSGMFMGIGFLFIGSGLAISSAGIILKNMAIGEAMIGVINACFFIGALASSVLAFRVVVTLGYIRAYAVFTAIFALSALAHGFANDIYYWAALRFLLGFAYFSIIMIAETLINAKTSNKDRSKLLAVYEVIFYCSYAIGVVILGLNLAPNLIFMISTFAIILGSIPLNIIYLEEPPLPQEKKFVLPNIFSVAPLALATCFVAGVATNGFFTMAGVYVIALGGTVDQVPSFMISAMVGGFLSQVLFGTYSYQWGRRKSILIAATMGTMAGMLMWFFSQSFMFLHLLVFLLGFGTFCLYSLGLARANDDLIDQHKSLEVGNVMLFSYIVGSLCAPLIMGMLMRHIGPSGFVLTYWVICSILFLYAIFQRTIPQENRCEETMATRPTDIVD